jgi:hypothetical protein
MSDAMKPRKSAIERADDGWDRGWKEHKRRQLIRMSKLSLAQKLQWLEDMQVLYDKFAKARKTPPKPSSSQQ